MLHADFLEQAGIYGLAVLSLGTDIKGRPIIPGDEWGDAPIFGYTDEACAWREYKGTANDVFPEILRPETSRDDPLWRGMSAKREMEELIIWAIRNNNLPTCEVVDVKIVGKDE